MTNSTSPHNIKIDDFRQKILKWYDKHQRAMPWRATKKKDRNPYYTWLSEIMLQQTTVVTVGPYFEKFIAKWPTVHDLAKANQDDVMHEWAGLGYYARARNLHKCAQIVSRELDGVFPQEQAELEELSGIGGYTPPFALLLLVNPPMLLMEILNALWHEFMRLRSLYQTANPI
jgi:A/G-specific adenine glycosylase